MSDIKIFKVRIEYTVKSSSDFDVIAVSEREAINFAHFRLQKERRDYADISDFKSRIIDCKP
jgi:hypothetical protein